jgi:hypothetical protein
MGTKMVRVGAIYGRGGLIPVGKTKFYDDIVHDDAGPEKQFIPGTNIPRLRLTFLAEGGARVAFEDEIEALVEGFRQMRNEKKAPQGRDRSRNPSKRKTNDRSGNPEG